MANVGKGRNGRPQVRTVGVNGWSRSKREVFLDVLAATANVTRAAAAAGMSDTSAYKLRQRDGAFALLWAAALEAGWVRLEEELLARALGRGCENENPGPVRAEPAAEHKGEFDPDLAIRILKLRRSNGPTRGRRAARAATQDEVDAELIRRLGALAERLVERDGEDGSGEAA